MRNPSASIRVGFGGKREKKKERQNERKRGRGSEIGPGTPSRGGGAEHRAAAASAGRGGHGEFPKGASLGRVGRPILFLSEDEAAVKGSRRCSYRSFNHSIFLKKKNGSLNNDQLDDNRELARGGFDDGGKWNPRGATAQHPVAGPGGGGGARASQRAGRPGLGGRGAGVLGGCLRDTSSACAPSGWLSASPLIGCRAASRLWINEAGGGLAAWGRGAGRRLRGWGRPSGKSRCLKGNPRFLWAFEGGGLGGWAVEGLLLLFKSFLVRELGTLLEPRSASARGLGGRAGELLPRLSPPASGRASHSLFSL